ncbi:lycopene cyclase domain-containing protein [Haladaptatus sp. DFWS20]|uniref:lycopene cyclase domain-containing protein n=1 Tax=Haladaptatus sp. DFWS20 TaxID=3403467 RepID=UPI003EBB1D83
MLPDIGAVFGSYTYLVSELVFGSFALWLLLRVDALSRAGKTILVLYPLGYVWDWYTLTIGVFSIPLRTGIDVAGIPLEEHLFIVVIPALVVGVHENLYQLTESAETDE